MTWRLFPPGASTGGGGGGGDPLEVREDGVSIDTDVVRIDFVDDIDVTQTAPGHVEVSVVAGAGSTPPFVDTQTIVKGSGDATKLIRFEVDGLTTGTTRVLTTQDDDHTIAGLELVQGFTANQRVVPSAAGVSGGFLVTDAALSNNFDVLVTADLTLSLPDNLQDGMHIFFVITQDETGGWTLDFASEFQFPNGIPPLLSIEPSARDVIACYWHDSDGQFLCVHHANFQAV